MTDKNIEDLLKESLGEKNPSSSRLAFLKQAINSAKMFITREGITLPSNNYTEEDAQLIVMYADYLIRKRATDDKMPRMLRWALNNRLFSEKGAADVT